MIEQILSFFFPPQLPERLSNWDARTDEDLLAYEQGSIGAVKPKKFRNGIERHFAEGQNESDR